MYQGLDVVVFATLKHNIREERDKWERSTGEKLKKSNFLGIYGRAHLSALTPENIKSAFRKTGVWPLDWNVITEDMMAPSKETSCEGHLPLMPATPVRLVATVLRNIWIKDDLKDVEEEEGESSDDSGEEDIGSGSNGDGDERTSVNNDEGNLSGEGIDGVGVELSAPDPADAIKHAIQQLSDMSLLELSSTGTRSTHETVSTPPAMITDALHIEPKTKNEMALLAALRESESRLKHLEKRNMELQATNILNEIYCKTLREQLAFAFDKKKNGNKKGKLMGDGLPVLLSGDWFYERVVEFEAWQKKDAREKAARKAAKGERQGAMEEYKKQVEERKRTIEKRREQWEKEKDQWERDKADAKAAKRKFGVGKPKLGKLPPAIPRPKINVEIIGSDDEGEEADVEDDEDEHSDSD